MKFNRSLMCAVAVAGGAVAPAAQATCTAEPYLASICITAATFCPRGYAEASGQLISIASNTAVFSLIGTIYGGDGRVTFALPDLRGRVPVGLGSGPGLSPVVEGQQGGAESTSLTVANLPPHSHTAQLNGTANAGNTDSPAGAVPAKLARSNVYNSGAATAAMGSSAVTVGTTGSGAPAPVRDPYLGLRYCIAMQGIYPSRP